MPENKIDPNAALALILKRMLAGGANDQQYEKPITPPPSDFMSTLDSLRKDSESAGPYNWGGAVGNQARAAMRKSKQDAPNQATSAWPSAWDQAPAEWGGRAPANLDPPADPFAAPRTPESLSDPNAYQWERTHTWDGQQWIPKTPFAR